MGAKSDAPATDACGTLNHSLINDFNSLSLSVLTGLPYSATVTLDSDLDNTSQDSISIKPRSQEQLIIFQLSTGCEVAINLSTFIMPYKDLF